VSTLRDVAKLAGVSLSTASRALNGSPGRPDARKTQERVLAAVRQLNYIPNDAAQHLGRGSSKKKGGQHLGTIGLILGTVSYKFGDPFWSVVLDGVDREATRHDHHLRFTFTLDDLTHSHQNALIDRAYIDGLILIGGHDSLRAIDDMAPWLRDRAMCTRTVVIDGGDERFYQRRPLEYDVVIFEKRPLIYQLIDHLVSRGYRNLAFLGPNATIDDRGAAFVQALAFHGLPFDPALYVECPWSTEGAYPAARMLLSSGKKIDAVVCSCDAIAISVMRAARELGIQLPQDLAIAGFDDIEFAQHMHPALTTIRVQKELLGEVAVRKLIERIRHPELPPLLHIVPGILVTRESCGELMNQPDKCNVGM
jgi:LacI family transcriptional regulator